MIEPTIWIDRSEESKEKNEKLRKDLAKLEQVLTDNNAENQ